MTRLAILTVALLTALASPAFAVQPDEVLDDPALEARAREISKDLRCVVCQNQSIDDSNAELARDLRLIVRERLVAGDTDDEVRTYVVDRYGDFVLLSPPLNAATVLLWVGPAIILLLGVGVAVASYRRHGRAAATAGPDLDAEEKNRIGELLNDDGDRPS